MKRSDKINRLKAKYGDGVISDFVITIWLKDFKLKALTQKYNMSSDVSKRIFEFLNSTTYHEFLTKKRIQKKAQIAADKKDPYKRFEHSKGTNNVHKGTLGEIRLFEVCKEKGFDIIPVFNRIDYKINGKKVELKTRFSSVKTNYSRKDSKRFYNFGRISDKEWKNLEFLICLIFPHNLFYIIPKSAITSRKVSLRDPNNPPMINKVKPSKYEPYKEAWHLIAEKK